jgi:hypothetical protein
MFQILEPDSIFFKCVLGLWRTDVISDSVVGDKFKEKVWSRVERGEATSFALLVTPIGSY